MEVHEEVEPMEEEVFIEGSHHVWIAERCTKLGYPVAGAVKDIYEDAVIFLPPLFSFDWGKGKGEMGRVLEILGQGNVWTFVIRQKDGPQVSLMYGDTYPCYFALPEDSEGKF